MSKKICKHCGAKEGEPQDGGKDRVRFYPDTEPFCFECHFWLEQFVADLTREGDRTVIVEDGGVLKHFIVAPEDDKSVMRGYGGHRFRILMNGAKVIETTNLWSQGEIPERFRGKSQSAFMRGFIDDSSPWTVCPTRRWTSDGISDLQVPGLSGLGPPSGGSGGASPSCGLVRALGTHHGPRSAVVWTMVDGGHRPEARPGQGTGAGRTFKYLNFRPGSGRNREDPGQSGSDPDNSAVSRNEAGGTVFRSSKERRPCTCS